MAYVYGHVNTKTNKFFYIGIGSDPKKRRAYNKRERPDYWKKYISENEYTVVIIEDNLSWESACNLEILLIKKYGRKMDKSGTLLNIASGGNGPFGVKRSDETKMKISMVKKNMSNETKMKISISRRNMSKENRKVYSDLAKNMPKEQRMKIAESFKKSYTPEMRKLAAIKSKNNLTKERIKKLAIGRSKIIINKENGVFYIGIEEAAIAHNLNKRTLGMYLQGTRKNKTNLVTAK